MEPAEHDLSFLGALASGDSSPLSPGAREALAQAAAVFRRAERFVVRTGGKAGRIGESVLETALVHGTLLALKRTRRRPPLVTLVVDDRVRELFAPALLHERFWSQVEVIAVPPAESEAAARAAALHGFEDESVLLDLNGGSVGAPFLRSERHRRGPHAPWRTLHTLGQLFHTAVVRFAVRGPERRYADFLETLFSLPAYTLDGYEVQPEILLTDEERAHATPMLRRLGVAPRTIPFLCFFQSVAVAKCYPSWWDVIEGIARAASEMGRPVVFLVVCGPNESGRAGLERADLEQVFGGFGVPGASVVFCEIPSLRDLVILATRCLTLANDTGPGHVAAAAGSPVVTPYLPGEVYPKRVWASTPRHRGISVEPSPFSRRQVTDAVLGGENWPMEVISPSAVVEVAVDAVRLRR